MKIQSVEDLKKISREYSEKLYTPDEVRVNIGMASCGIAAGAKSAYEKALEVFPEGSGVQICKTGCIGFCEEEPLVEVFTKGKPRLMYKNITEDKIVDIINGYREGDFTANRKSVLGQIKDPRSILEDDISNPVDGVTPVEDIPFMEDIPFYKGQLKIALRNCGYIDPNSIEEYIAKGGYFALVQSIENNKSKDIIQAIKDSELRGRGGGGFPAGIKWATCAK
ncbi:hypothetical protein QUF76_18945, partial [Desulfobacterales bacterium HSG16]|nr:hypothetical protein [Desulfobacterales bacterium HSG16]